MFNVADLNNSQMCKSSVCLYKFRANSILKNIEQVQFCNCPTCQSLLLYILKTSKSHDDSEILGLKLDLMSV